MKVTRLPKDTGLTGWNEILPKAKPFPQLKGKNRADWVVIGAGFAGLAAARRLSQLCPTDRIIILEASRVAQGPAGRNSGFMIDLPHDLSSEDYAGDTNADKAQIALNRAGINFAAVAAREYAMPPEAFSCSGKINAAASPKGMKQNADYAAHLKLLGEAYEIFDAQKMQSITGSNYFTGGLYTPGAAMIQPAMFVRAMATGIVSDGVELFENSPVTALRRTDNHWTATTSSGEVSAPKIILAVNGHAENFGYFKHRLMHVFTYASMSRALSSDEISRLGGESIWACTPADPMGTTVRRISGHGGDRIIVRNRFTYEPSMEIGKRQIARAAIDHDKAFARRFPMLSGVAMEYRWGGRLCLSLNGGAAFGEVDDGLYTACCQNGLGVAKGTLSGLLAAEFATGRQSDLLVSMHQEPDPTRLPPKPLAYLGATAIIRWKEWKAGAEK